MFDVSDLVAHWGYAAIFLIVVLGNVGLPVPEETVLLAGGYMVWRGDLKWSLLVAVGILSAVTGDNLGYWLGRRYGERVLDRCRRLARLGPERFHSMESFMRRWGFLGVFAGRFMPGFRFLAGPLAGAVGLRFAVFFPANALAAAVYVPVVTGCGYGVGYGIGAYVERLLRGLGPVGSSALIGLAVLAFSALVWRLRRWFR